jgi:predicted nucleic acid-binding protein
MYKIVIDTNVIVSALRSRRGASFAVLQRIGDVWEHLISVPLILEYEAVGKREAERLGIPGITVDAIVRAFC